MRKVVDSSWIFARFFQVESLQSEMGPLDHELDVQVDEETTEGG